MVDRTRKFHSERTSHDSSELSKQMADSKIQDPKREEAFPTECEADEYALEKAKEWIDSK